MENSMSMKIVIVLLLVIFSFQVFQYVTRDNYKEEFLEQQNEKILSNIADLKKAIDTLNLDIALTDTTIYNTKNYYNEKTKEIYFVKDANILNDSVRAIMQRLVGARFD